MDRLVRSCRSLCSSLGYSLRGSTTVINYGSGGIAAGEIGTIYMGGAGTSGPGEGLRAASIARTAGTWRTGFWRA